MGGWSLHIYMDKRTATALHLLKTLGENGEIPGGVGRLCSKYVFCDRADFELVLSVLNAPSEPSEAEKYWEWYLKNTAGLVKNIAVMDLPSYITLSQEVWELSELLDNDTLEYLTSPVSVQMLDPDKWDELYLLLQNRLPGDARLQ